MSEQHTKRVRELRQKFRDSVDFPEGDPTELAAMQVWTEGARDELDAVIVAHAQELGSALALARELYGLSAQKLIECLVANVFEPSGIMVTAARVHDKGAPPSAPPLQH